LGINTLKIPPPLVTNSSVAIITGASSGIGEATAIAMAKAGFRVVLAARRKAELTSIIDKIHQDNGQAVAFATDLSDEKQTHKLIEKTLKTYGRIDVLVNNAGFSPASALEQLSRDEIRQTFEVNLFPALQLISEVTPIMRKQGGGRIINMSSMTSRVYAPLAVPYAATKGGMESATHCLRLELAPWNIHLSIVIPGFVETPAFDKARASGESLRNAPENPYRTLMDDMDRFAQSQLKNAAAPEDVAKAVVEAASCVKPRQNYYVPFSSKIVGAISSILPQGWLDWLISKLYGISAWLDRR
jgi:NAD(P)-dependent dehydrogenase (short-subunit alcohol dehydrogenase family)